MNTLDLDLCTRQWNLHDPTDLGGPNYALTCITRNARERVRSSLGHGNLDLVRSRGSREELSPRGRSSDLVKGACDFFSDLANDTSTRRLGMHSLWDERDMCTPSVLFVIRLGLDDEQGFAFLTPEELDVLAWLAVFKRGRRAGKYVKRANVSEVRIAGLVGMLVRERVLWNRRVNAVADGVGKVGESKSVEARAIK